MGEASEMSSSSDTEQETPPVLKQAVVVIHGMGEPVPMDTMRSFVDAVWEKDQSFSSRLKSDPTSPACDCEARNPYWIVPDTRTGSLELYRITTPPYLVGPEGEETEVRTDFYEFYWSDIMEGTTFEHVRAWVMELLLRWPHQVPARVILAWYVLWFAVLLALFLAVAGFLQFSPDWQWRGLAEPFGMEPDDLGKWLTVIATALALGIMVYRLAVAEKPQGPHWKLAHSWLFSVGAPLAAGTAAWHWMPWNIVLSAPFLLLGLSVLLGISIQLFLVPYFGDVARYVRAVPNTIAKRAEVRNRGLDLLRALHGKPRDDGNARDSGDRYDRIVVVAHSLGSIIAYDILNHFWAEVGPTRANPPDPIALEKLDEIDRYISQHMEIENRRAVLCAGFDPDTFRGLQGEACAALATQADGNGWRVTDFVTLGSPLSHAAFLMARDALRLQERIEDRQAPTCPPYPDPKSKRFLYPREDEDPEPFKYAHHAAVFAVTRWTNIYDPHSRLWIFLGDLISGRIAELMGRGIRDIGVKMSRRFLGIPGIRLFTHTRYWSMDTAGETVEAARLPEVQGKCACGRHRRAHIAALRQAIRLDEILRPPTGRNATGTRSRPARRSSRSGRGG